MVKEWEMSEDKCCVDKRMEERQSNAPLRTVFGERERERK